MAVNTRNSIVTNGLVLALDAGNTKSYTSGSSVIRDLANPLVSGSLLNNPTFSNQNGGCLVFNGVNNFVTTNNISLSGSQTFNVVFSVNGQADPPISGIFTNHKYTENANIGLNYTGYKICISIGYTDGSREYNIKQSNYTLTDNKITISSLVFDNLTNTISLYVNGVFDNSWVLTKTVKFVPWVVYLGVWSDYSDYYINGRIYQGQIYNKALSAQEITQNYNAGKTRFGLA
jgi:hypothetical protein